MGLNLVMLGPPGAGKGTQAVRLARKWAIPHVSTGAILRDAVRADTPLGREVKAILESGALVDDGLVSRIVFTGAGGFDNRAPGLQFLLSPRVPHLVRVVSNESMHTRGIFHTKDEPLCGGGYRRLHVLCGEALCSEASTWLRVATTALVVCLAEAGVDVSRSVQLTAPLGALRAFAADYGTPALLRAIHALPRSSTRPMAPGAMSSDARPISPTSVSIGGACGSAWNDCSSRLRKSTSDVTDSTVNRSTCIHRGPAAPTLASSPTTIAPTPKKMM